MLVVRWERGSHGDGVWSTVAQQLEHQDSIERTVIQILRYGVVPWASSFILRCNSWLSSDKYLIIDSFNYFIAKWPNFPIEVDLKKN